MFSDQLSIIERQALALSIQTELNDSPMAYALIDAAFYAEPVFVTKAEQQLGQAHNVMDHIPGAEPTFSVLLFALPDEPEYRSAAIETALALCNGQPMLSFLGTTHPIAVLKEHLHFYTEALLLPERTHFVLRCADTRITPLLFKHLTPEQSAILLGPIQRWISIDRAGASLVWKGEGSNTFATSSPEFTPEQVDALLAETLPDQLLRQIAEQMDHNRLSKRPSERHKMVLQWLAEAKQQGLTDDAKVSVYCEMQALEAISDRIEK